MTITKPKLLINFLFQFFFLLINQPISILAILQPSQTCPQICDHHLSQADYEHCMSQCDRIVAEHYETSKQTVDVVPLPVYGRDEAPDYPSAPTNVRVNFRVHVERNAKYIEATLHWNATHDPRRTAYYVSMFANERECEKLFSGYYAQNIPANATKWDIPLTTPDYHHLQIEHGCSYRLELHSVPYPYGDPKYQQLINFTVPTCVQGYCHCEAQPVLPPVDSFAIQSFYDSAHRNRTRARLMWKYKFENTTDQSSKTVTFHIKLGDQVKVTNKRIAGLRLFKWRKQGYAISAIKDKTDYEFVLPDLLDNNVEYKTEIVAINEHICKSDVVQKEFKIALPARSDLESTVSTPTPSPTSTVDSATITSHPTAQSTHTDTTIVQSTTTTSTTTQKIPPSVLLPSSRHFFLILLLVFAALFLLCTSCVLVGKLYLNRKKQLKEKKIYADRLKMRPWATNMSGSFYANHGNTMIMETNILYTDKEIAECQAAGMADQLEIPYTRLRLGRVIGQGAFGLVYLGTADAIAGIAGPTTVAIKQLKADATDFEQRQFLEEIAIMKQVGPHANIVSMFGCCTLQYPQCMVMEYVPYGDLKQYLQNLRRRYEQTLDEYRTSVAHDYVMHLALPPADLLTRTPPPSMTTSMISQGSVTIIDDIPFVDEFLSDQFADLSDLTYSLDPVELESFALQIANGMAHIEAAGVTHRDLAARNILVGHGKVLKISDFGLSRQGIYVKTTKGVIPLRWLSIEAMRDHVYSTKSDVWAYGMVLWEICTLGGFPYPTVSDKDLLGYLEAGNRPEKPTSCSDEFFHLMFRCWAYHPHHRPSFAHIRDRLADWSKRASPYVDFAGSNKSRSETPATRRHSSFLAPSPRPTDVDVMTRSGTFLRSELAKLE